MKKTFTIAVTSLLFFSQNRVDAQLISSGLNHSVFVCSSPGTPVLLGRDDQVSSLNAITAVSAGHSFSLFLSNVNTVYAVGDNIYGQLGDNSTTGRTTPVQVTGLSGIIAISAGESHSLFLKSDGTVWATGSNFYGELGDGTTTDKHIAVRVGTLTGIMAISAGRNHSLFLKSDGTVWACGKNQSGQLGDNSTTNRSGPVQVSGLTGVSAIAAGHEHSLFIKSGAVWACGFNGNGQLGDNSTTNRLAPVQVNGLTGITAIDAADHSLFLKNDGTVWACGSAYYGQLGNGTNTDVLNPVQLTALSNITKISAGGFQSLFLKNDGTVWACGYNLLGNMGLDVVDGQAYKTPVQWVNRLTTTGTTAVSTGSQLNIALIASRPGTTFSWVAASNPNISGASTTASTGSTINDVLTNLSRSTQTVSYTVTASYCGSAPAVRVVTVTVTAPQLVFAGNSQSAFLCSSPGTPSLAGDNVYFPAVMSGISDVRSMSLGVNHSLYLKSDGTAWASGSNTVGQLGDNTNTNRTAPVQVNGLTGITSVAASKYAHSLFLKNNGTVWACGTNGWGQLGDGTNIDKNSTVQVSGLSNVIAIAAGYDHSLFLKSDGTVWGCGSNSDGQLGLDGGFDVGHYTPVQVIGLSGITAIAAGYNFSLFLKNDGTVWGCGNSSYGQLGGSFGSYRVAVQISPLSNIVKIAGGLNHSIFLKNDGTVWACGSNVYGQLGTGSSNTFDNPVPVQMSALSNITQFSAGSDYSLFLSADGKVWVCGDNALGQLGVGANAQTTQVATPSRWSNAITSAATVTSACGSPVNLTLTAFRPGSTFTWVAANNPNVTGESATVQTTGSINDVLINGTSVAQTVSYTVTADACGAMGSTQTVTVTVNPVAAASIANVIQCAGIPIVLTGTPAGGVFSIPNPYVGASTSYSYTYNLNGCSSTANATITVHPVSTLGATAFPSATVCAGSPLMLTGTGAANYSWSGGVQNGVPFTPAASGIYTVTGTDINGCSANVRWVKISTGASHSLGIKSDGTLWSWGNNGLGQLGDGTMAARSVLTQVGTATNWVDVSAGFNFSLGLRSDGTLWGWGDNGVGELGDPTHSNTRIPFQVGTGTNWVSISAGSQHSLGLKSDGTLWAWGQNNNGQLGNGANTIKNVPVQIGTGTWTAIAGGGSHSLGVRSDGTLWAWGMNNNGQLGEGTTTSSNTPVQVGTATNWVSIAAGSQHSLGRRSDGTLWAWGDNFVGQSGSGAPTSGSSTPLQVGTGTNWTSVSAGNRHSLGLQSDGTLWAWGYNNDGELGNGATATRFSPAQIAAGMAWSAISGGGSYSLGIKSDGIAWGWGDNGAGQIGDGTTTNHLSPTPLLNQGGLSIRVTVKPVPEIGATASPSSTICAGKPVTLNGTGESSYSWSGGVTNGVAFTPTSTATYTVTGTGANGCTNTATQTITVNQLPSVGATISPSANICSGSPVTLTGTGAITYSWSGGITNGAAFTPSSTTTYTVTGTDAKGCMNTASQTITVNAPPTVTAGNVSGCLGAAIALQGSPTGGVFSVANPYSGPATTYTYFYTDANGCSATSAPAITQVNPLPILGVTASPSTSVCAGTAVTLSGTGATNYSWSGGVTNGVSFTPVTTAAYTLTGTDSRGCSGIQNWTKIEPGSTFSLAIKSDKTLWAWGDNGSGQLGTGTNTNSSSPVQVGTATNWVNISGGESHSLGVKSDGTLWAWGDNSYGELGIGTTVNTNSPVQVGTGTNWVGVSAGNFYSLGIKSDGTVWAWGANIYGELGDGTNTDSYQPIQIGTGTNWVNISAGAAHSLAIKSDGSLWTWGYNAAGQLGDGTNVDKNSPVRVGSASNWAGVSGGLGHSLALRSDGTLWAWGNNANGQLGNGTNTITNVPVQISNGTNWQTISAGRDHSLGIRSDGTLWSWGYNLGGGLGDGTTTDRNIPVQVGTGTNWQSIAGGSEHSLGIRSGALLSWGYNGGGVLGDGTITSSATPVQTINQPGLRITVNVSPAPTVGITVSPSATVNAGTPVTLNGTGANTYSWSGGVTNGVPFVPSTTTTYTVTGTSSNGCQNTTSQTITVNAATVVSASNVNGCAGTAIALSGSPAGGTFSLPNPYTGPATTYTYSYTDVNGHTTTSEPATITINALPVAAITNNSGTTELTCAATSINVTATGGTSYSWTGGATPATAANSFTVPGVYTVTVTGTNGCTSTASITISQNLAAPSASASSNSPVTAGGTLILSSTGGAGLSWSWSGPGFTSTLQNPTITNVTTAATGVYTVTITNLATGCSGSAQTSVTINNNPCPSPVITPNTPSFCQGGSVTLSSTSGLSYQWYRDNTAIGGAKSQTYTATTAGSYYVVVNVSSSCGTRQSAAVTVTLNAPPARPVTTSASRCGAGSVTLTASGSGTLKWYNNSLLTTLLNTGTTYTINTSVNVTYYVTATSAFGCVSGSSPVTATINSLPTAYTVTGGSGCSSVTPGLAGSQTGINYQLFRGTTALNTIAGTGGSISFGVQTIAGSYTVVATRTLTGCTNAMAGSASVTGASAPAPTIANAYTNNNNPRGVAANTIYKNFVSAYASLTLVATASGTGLTYAWRNSNNQVVGNGSSLLVSSTGTYTVTVTNSGGCSGTATKSVALVDVKCSGNKVQVCNGGNSQCVTTSQAQSLLSSGASLGTCVTITARPAPAAITLATELQMQAYPNPSNTYFTLTIKSSKPDRIEMKVTDMLGRLIEVKPGIMPNGTIQVGSKYAVGTYIVQIMQGDEKRVLKLIKGR